MGLAHAVERTIRRHAMLAGGDTVLVAVSGGADSVALLHILRELAPMFRLTLYVLHVDHGLRAESARDAEFVRALGVRLEVPVVVERVVIGPGSVEAAARDARYAALEAWADRLGADRIAIGHSADDQAETVLMRLLDGAGVRGLAGIPPRRGRVIRPLIETRRQALRDALLTAGREWVEDDTNRDPTFLRNRIRHELLPLLAASYATDVVPSLARAARRARESVDALERVASDALERLATMETGALTLPRGARAARPPPVAAETLRQAAARLGSRAPLRAWAHRGLRRVLASVPPRRPVRLGGVTVEVSGDRVRVGAGTPSPLASRTHVVPGRLDLPELGRTLQARLVPAAGYSAPRTAECVAFDAAGVPRVILVRRRRAGDRFEAFGGGARRVKSFLIDAKVPRWERARVPILEADGRILWIAGLRRGAAAPLTRDTQEVLEIRLTAPR